MTKFQGYYLGWNRCAECGQPLRLVGNSLRHLRGGLEGSSARGSQEAGG